MEVKLSSLRDFDVISKLGQGAFGQVFKVKRKADLIEYALKKVKLGAMKEKEKDNALNEIRILASYNEQYIIGYKEAFYDQQSATLCIVMQFASQGDLLKKIQLHQKTRTKFKEEQIWKALVHMAKGLKSLHDKKILHRDLKCANVFITGDGKFKLGDLNVSKVLKKDMASTQTGTPYYASPEVWKDKPYGLKSDMWSLGCVLYEMAALKSPFNAYDLQSLYKKVVAGVFDRISLTYSNDLSNVINSLLKVDPEKRPDTQTLLSHPLVHKNYNGQIHEEAELSPQELLKTIKYNPKDLKGLRNYLPKANYVEDREQNNVNVNGSASCKNLRKQPSSINESKAEQLKRELALDEHKIQAFLQRKKAAEEKEREKQFINQKLQQREQESKRAMSACGPRTPSYHSPKIVTHEKKDSNVFSVKPVRKEERGSLINPKMPPKPPVINLNYKLPPKPAVGQNNQMGVPGSSRQLQSPRQKSKENLKNAGISVVSGNRPSTASRESPRCSSAQKVIYPPWWG